MSRNRTGPGSAIKSPLMGSRGFRGAARAPENTEAFESFSASQLYCPKCKQAMPVRERMLLVLSSGELYDYLCSSCGTSLGTRQT